MNLIIWIVLFAIAVSDAKEHRIPNIGVLMVILLALADKVFILQDLSVVIWSGMVGIACFFVSLGLYFLKVMAPGDVKLLGAIGFWLGPEHITHAVFWIALFSVVIGLFFAFLRMAEAPEKTKELLQKYSLVALHNYPTSAVTETYKSASRAPYRMPFAPVIVLGVAAYFYFLNQ
ncbi:prepilin peptidase [Vibrio sp. OCN044]|uniref:Prepilin peptidase n=1 Tax=Vibrio tetraodonis subsp. pristinus TaxID=2695891 RepID=A0A6L8LPU7_9VIBR|nr:prepilin peptidase [Vibrio tetraodonis]MYM57643.1 prepilin peptidase [Vibrio tetraodonis subsp. pristinus]